MKLKTQVLLLTYTVSQLGGIAVCADEPPQQLAQKSKDDEKVEYRRFEGKWELRSAAYQTGSRVTYLFDEETLVIVRRSPLTAMDGTKIPQWENVERYSYRLDINRAPNQMILARTEGDSTKEQKMIYEFRDSMLWICPDEGPTPKSRTALTNGQFGDGRLEGLARSSEQH